MNARPFLTDISQEVVNAYKNIYKDDLMRVYLYGSYSRGEETSESDIDYLALVDSPAREIKSKLHELWDITADIDLERDVVISAMAANSDDYNNKQDISPYFCNVKKDGVMVYDRSGNT